VDDPLLRWVSVVPTGDEAGEAEAGAGTEDEDSFRARHRKCRPPLATEA
jgi:hypothetical protein